MLGMVDHRNDKVYEDIYRELEEIAMKDETLKSAFQNWEQLSMTQEEFLAYESRLKRILDEEAAQREAELRIQEVEKREQEVKQREQEAKQREQEAKQNEQKSKRAIARRLLSMEMDIDDVVMATELTKDEMVEILGQWDGP